MGSRAAWATRGCSGARPPAPDCNTSAVRVFLVSLLAGAVFAAGAAGTIHRGAAAPTFGRGTATLSTSTGNVVLSVEIASTDRQRQRGLMHRRSLGAKAGMVFAYESPASGGFWMKNTLIPLDIAFYDVRGRILRTLRMQPCKADPCPIYSPGVSYRGALEVNAGSFRRWGVSRGDRLTVRAATTAG